MKKLFFTILSFCAFNITFAQDDSDVDYTSGNYDILEVLYADEKYEKLLKVAEKFTMKDATKNDAEPYLYLSMGLFAMSKDENYTSQDKYKKSYNESLTWLGKYYKKSKDQTLFKRHIKFFNEIKMSVYESIDTDISGGNYAKALGNISKIAKVSPNNFAQDFLTGACNFQKGDKTTARDNWKKGEALLKNLSKEDFMKWEQPDKLMLALGLVETAKCYVKSKKQAEAKTLLTEYLKFFENIEFYSDYLSEIK